MTYSQLVKKLREIKERGFVRTHRANDTGIGKTLEDLLGIKENNLRVPDVGKVELKAKRLGSGSMLTLATKSPEPKGANKALFERYKYLDEFGYYNLHSTICGSKSNPQGFKLAFKDGKLMIENSGDINVYYPLSVFADVLVSKSNKILLVFAETKGEPKTLNERFHFVESYLLEGLDFDKFKKAVENDKLKVDIRIGVYRSGKSKGKFHDHGTGLRISKRDFLELFASYKQII
ncbi:MAG: MvaI/BcnI family restriction endonuclease [Patescibacteria group bacterium]|nr:MvaI/BcnI family restriction endonuclease [Patescibacteria group bacterium]